MEERLLKNDGLLANRQLIIFLENYFVNVYNNDGNEIYLLVRLTKIANSNKNMYGKGDKTLIKL